MGSDVGGDSGIDTDEGYTINGGSLVILGTDMIETPIETSKQTSLSFTLDETIKEGTIVEQDIKKGEKLGKGDSITLTVAKIITVYPDFVNEGYTLDQVTSFCEDNGIVLQSTAKETSDYKENTIITQSRTAGSKVVKGVTLRVTYAKAPAKVETPKTDDKTETTKNDKTDDKTNTDNKKTDKVETIE